MGARMKILFAVLVYIGEMVVTGVPTSTVTGVQTSTVERPTVAVTPRSITIAVGTTGALRSRVTGSPQPTITWSRSRAELTDRHQITGEMLRIVNAKMEDRGVYVCRAENSFGVDQAWAIVEVKATTDPAIRIDKQTANAGERVEIECVVTGTTTPTISWSKLEGALPATASLNGTLLVIPAVQPKDAGTYVCTAQNEVGSIQMGVNLYVRI